MLNTSLNWDKKRTWSDRDNAIFFASVFGDGTFVHADRIKQLPRHSQTIKEFTKRIYHIKSVAYMHPLQKWRGDYVIFHQSSNVVGQNDIYQLQKIVTKWFVSKKPADKLGLSKNVITQYLTVVNTVQKVPVQLSIYLEKLKLFGLVHDAARNFIATNRQHELKLFDKFYPTAVPPDCFVSVYETGCVSGISRHCDHVSFCTVVLCLKGTAGKDLTLTQENNEDFVVPLSAGDLIVFARIGHFVEFRARTERRITLNAFF